MIVVSVSCSPEYTFSKPAQSSIELLEGIGVDGDVHAGRSVKHRSRVARDASQPNLRQVHLIHAELFDDLLSAGYEVRPGQMGENVTTRGVDLLGLPTATRLHLGGTAIVEVTGLRNPCVQIDNFRNGLLKQVLGRDDDGNVVRLAGVMGVVRAGGIVRPGDKIKVDLPEQPHRPLQPV